MLNKKFLNADKNLDCRFHNGVFKINVKYDE